MRLIDGDSLKRKAQKVATESWKMKIRAYVETVLNQFIDWIDAAPTIEERKRGKWLLYTQRDGIETGSECSQCGYHIYIPPQYGHNFCPNCGANMKGEQDD